MRESTLSKFKVVEECWLWTGATHSGGRYGNIQGLQAHRVVAHLAGVHIPADRVADHLCCNTLCVNPTHLEAVTQRENIARGRAVMASALATGRCVNGHEYDPSNTYVTPDGRRNCRACRRAQARRTKEKV